MTNRDYIYQRTLQYEAKDDQFIVSCKSSEETSTDFPIKSVGKTVRVETFSSTCFVKSLGEDNVEFHILYNDGLTGVVPSYVLKTAISTIIPSSLIAFQKACGEYATFVEKNGSSLTINVVQMRALSIAVEEHVEDKDDASPRHSSVTSSCRTSDTVYTPRRRGVLGLWKWKTEDFDVCFHQQLLGLEFGFEKGKKRGRPIALSILINSEADQNSTSGHRIHPGTILLRINNISVRRKSLEDTLKCIADAGRPITLQFRSQLPKKQKNALEAYTMNGITTLMVKRNAVLVQHLQPVVAANGSSVVAVGASLARNCTVVLERSNTSNNSVILEVGMTLKGVDGIYVLKKSFDEITTLLLDEKTQTHFQKLEFVRFSPKNQKKWFLTPLSIDTSGSTPTVDCINVESSECLEDYSKVTVSKRNIEWSMTQVDNLFCNERLISAGLMIDRVNGYFRTPRRSNSEEKGYIEDAPLRLKWKEQKSRNKIIRERRDLGIVAVSDFCSKEDDSEWTLAQDLFGVKTFVKPGKG